MDTLGACLGVVSCVCACLRKLSRGMVQLLLPAPGNRRLGQESQSGDLLKRAMGIGITRSLHDKMEKLESSQCCKGPHYLINWIMLNENTVPCSHGKLTSHQSPPASSDPTQPLHSPVKPRCFPGAEHQGSKSQPSALSLVCHPEHSPDWQGYLANRSSGN